MLRHVGESRVNKRWWAIFHHAHCFTRSCIAGIGMFSSHKNRIRKDCNGDRRDHHINEANMMIGEKGEISRGMEAMI